MRWYGLQVISGRPVNDSWNKTWIQTEHKKKVTHPSHLTSFTLNLSKYRPEGLYVNVLLSPNFLLRTKAGSQSFTGDGDGQSRIYPYHVLWGVSWGNKTRQKVVDTGFPQRWENLKMVMEKSWNKKNLPKATKKLSIDVESLHFPRFSEKRPQIQFNREERWWWKIRKWSWKSHGKMFRQICGNPVDIFLF